MGRRRAADRVGLFDLEIQMSGYLKINADGEQRLSSAGYTVLSQTDSPGEECCPECDDTCSPCLSCADVPDLCLPKNLRLKFSGVCFIPCIGKITGTLRDPTFINTCIDFPQLTGNIQSGNPCCLHVTISVPLDEYSNPFTPSESNSRGLHNPGCGCPELKIKAPCDGGDIFDSCFGGSVNGNSVICGPHSPIPNATAYLNITFTVCFYLDSGTPMMHIYASARECQVVCNGLGTFGLGSACDSSFQPNLIIFDAISVAPTLDSHGLIGTPPTVDNNNNTFGTTGYSPLTSPGFDGTPQDQAGFGGQVVVSSDCPVGGCGSPPSSCGSSLTPICTGGAGNAIQYDACCSTCATDTTIAKTLYFPLADDPGGNTIVAFGQCYGRTGPVNTAFFLWETPSATSSGTCSDCQGEDLSCGRAYHYTLCAGQTNDFTDIYVPCNNRFISAGNYALVYQFFGRCYSFVGITSHSALWEPPTGGVGFASCAECTGGSTPIRVHYVLCDGQTNVVTDLYYPEDEDLGTVSVSALGSCYVFSDIGPHNFTVDPTPTGFGSCDACVGDGCASISPCKRLYKLVLTDCGFLNGTYYLYRCNTLSWNLPLGPSGTGLFAQFSRSLGVFCQYYSTMGGGADCQFTFGFGWPGDINGCPAAGSAIVSTATGPNCSFLTGSPTATITVVP